MEDIELKNIWQSYDKKIEEARVLNLQSWALNLKCFETIQQQKAETKLSSLARFKISALVLGIIWVLFLGMLVWGNHFQNIYFSSSVSIIFLFSVYAIVAYIKQVVLIKQIDYEGNIFDTQNKLAKLQLSTLQSTRILWLQLPFYATFFWNDRWISHGTGFWLTAFPVALLLALLAVYLYRNITLANLHKKWVKTFMMMGPEYKNVVQAIAFINELDEFKSDQLQ